MFFLLIGNRHKTKQEGSTARAVACPSCGTYEHFERKSTRNYLTLFFLPVVPLGGARRIAECPRCRAQFDDSDGRFGAA